MTVDGFRIRPSRGTYRPGEPVELVADIPPTADGMTLLARVNRVDRTVATLDRPVAEPRTVLTWMPPEEARAGYGVDAELLDRSGAIVATATTAFDVLDSWVAAPRYGFLTDFTPGRDDLEETFAELTRYHVNGLQFYDWQYRHDDLVAPTENYLDPLGRTLSLETIRDAIERAHGHGMAAMAYVAVYAASVPYWREHPGQALYDRDGQALRFGDDFLGLMDPTPGGGWASHLLDQCARALELGFDGIHFDQYGEPRVAFDATGDEVDIPAAFAGFIDEFKSRHPEAPVTLNAVKNWPLETLAQSRQDFTYIELWPDTPTYADLRDIVLNARALADKPVVVALYQPAEHTANLALTDALILACGASRIEVGERGRLLSNPYFPKHEPLDAELGGRIRRYHDFAVRYGELIGPAATVALDVAVETDENLAHFVFRAGAWITVALVNLLDLAGPRWDRPHPPAQPRRDVAVTIKSAAPVRDALGASPDATDVALRPLQPDETSGALTVSVPVLDNVTFLFLRTDPEIPT